MLGTNLYRDVQLLVSMPQIRVGLRRAFVRAMRKKR